MQKQLLLPVLFGFLGLVVGHSVLAQELAGTFPGGKKLLTGSKLNNDLQQVRQASRPTEAAKAPAGTTAAVRLPSSMQVRDGFVVVDAVAEPGQVEQLLRALVALGLQDAAVAAPVVSGRFPINRLAELEGLKPLRFVRAASQGQSGAGKALSQGDNLQGSAQARGFFKVNGTGVKVGIISNTFNRLGGLAQGIKNGELPGPGNPDGFLSPVEILQEGIQPLRQVDEGRAMAEIVHDVAPGAKIAFHQGLSGGLANVVQGIQRLVSAGCQVIADDIYYTEEPFFQDDQITRAISQAAAKGVTYTVLAGNFGFNSYEKPFSLSNQGFMFGPDHNFSPDPNIVDTKQSITVNPNAKFIVTLQWDQPFFSVTGNASKAATSDLDIYLLDKQGNILARGDNANIGNDPVESFEFTNPTNIKQSYDIVIESPVLNTPNPAPRNIKYIIFESPAVVSIDEYATKSSTIYGKQLAAAAITVGASAFYNKNAAGQQNVNVYSSLGGGSVRFDITGNALSGPVRQKPDLVGPDGCNNSFFGPLLNIPQDHDAFPNFFGTSAATPHVAGVVALMIEASRTTLAPATIKNLLTGSALDMDNPLTPGFDTGFDFYTGYGFVRAAKAVFNASIASIPGSNDRPVAAKLGIAPNPTEGPFQLSFVREAEDDTQVEIYNAWGKRVSLLPIRVHPGVNVVTLTPDLPGGGSYIVRLADRPAENAHLLKP